MGYFKCIYFLKLHSNSKEEGTIFFYSHFTNEDTKVSKVKSLGQGRLETNQASFDTEGETEVQGGIIAFPRSHNQVRDTIQAPWPPVQGCLASDMWWVCLGGLFQAGLAHQAPQLKHMTQREGTAFPHRPVPLL